MPAVTHVSFLSDSMHRGGFVGVLGLRFVVLDVSVSLSPAVAAAVRLEFDVAASLLPAVAAAAISTKGRWVFAAYCLRQLHTQNEFQPET